VEAYLAMEQMRLGDRLRVAWAWPEACDGVVLPPFFLQTLVENAIKHGISPSDIGGEVRIICRRKGSGMLLRVENDGLPLPSGFIRGVGLGNLESRLGLWEEASGSFTLERREGRTVATLQWVPKEQA
jgi:two-component system sensor histidine kinase AlgZ